jgi:uncharacterized membrane protein
MASTATRGVSAALHPVHAILLASALPLFLGALLSDIAYARSYEIQWTNFSSWLIAGGLVFCALALLWATIDLLRTDRRARGRPLLYWLLLLATFLIGFVNALVHAKDAWASMPAALILSAVAAILTIATVAVGFSTPRGSVVE